MNGARYQFPGLHLLSFFLSLRFSLPISSVLFSLSPHLPLLVISLYFLHFLPQSSCPCMYCRAVAVSSICSSPTLEQRGRTPIRPGLTSRKPAESQTWLRLWPTTSKQPHFLCIGNRRPLGDDAEPCTATQKGPASCSSSLVDKTEQSHTKTTNRDV